MSERERTLYLLICSESTCTRWRLMDRGRISDIGKACGNSGASTFWPLGLTCVAFRSCAIHQTCRNNGGSLEQLVASNSSKRPGAGAIRCLLDGDFVSGRAA